MKITIKLNFFFFRSSDGQGRIFQSKHICIYYVVKEKNILVFVKSHPSVYCHLEQFCQPFGQLDIDVGNQKVNVFRTERVCL